MGKKLKYICSNLSIPLPIIATKYLTIQDPSTISCNILLTTVLTLSIKGQVWLFIPILFPCTHRQIYLKCFFVKFYLNFKRGCMHNSCFIQNFKKISNNISKSLKRDNLEEKKIYEVISFWGLDRNNYTQQSQYKIM